jgi:hypothetical protein
MLNIEQYISENKQFRTSTFMSNTVTRASAEEEIKIKTKAMKKFVVQLQMVSSLLRELSLYFLLRTPV